MYSDNLFILSVFEFNTVYIQKRYNIQYKIT